MLWLINEIVVRMVNCIILNLCKKLVIKKIKRVLMADIAFNWSKMESDLDDADYSKNYLHAELADFTGLKERYPENIWILRLEQDQYWLLGRLHVDEKITQNIKGRKKHWITFDPDKSEFYSKPLEVQTYLGETLIKMCNKMFGTANGQGAASVMLLQPTEISALKKANSGNEKISFHDFVAQLKSGKIDGVPFRKGKLKLKSASTSAHPSKVRIKIDSEQLMSDVHENSSEKIKHVPDTNLNSSPDSLNKNGKRRSISPEEDEKIRKRQAENGAEGEELARLFEIERLRDLKCPDSTAYVNHVAKIDVGLGYDILTTWDETRYIEVKTSENGSDGFFISSNEVAVLTSYNNLAWIYLVDLSKKDDLKNCVKTINNPGDKFHKEIKLVPKQYNAILLNFS